MKRQAIVHWCAITIGLIFCVAAWAAKEGDVHKDWTVGCETLPTDEERCFIYQVVMDEEEKPMVYVAIGYRGEQKEPSAMFTVPLGVILPPGLAVKVDDSEPIRFRYSRCLPHGCVAPLPMDDKIVTSFKRGAKMEVIVFDNKGPVAIPKPISLSGFTKGFQSISP